MVFSFSVGPVPLLFAGVEAGPDLISFAFAVFAVVGLGVARQELVHRAELASEVNAKTGLFFAQALVSYLLMLVAMTFNAWLFLAVLTGLTWGHHRMLKQQQHQQLRSSGKKPLEDATTAATTTTTTGAAVGLSQECCA